MIDVSLFFMFFVSYLGIGLMILIPVILIQRKIERWMKEDKIKIKFNKISDKDLRNLLAYRILFENFNVEKVESIEAVSYASRAGIPDAGYPLAQWYNQSL